MTENCAGNICTNCQMFFENMELLTLHSCVEIKQETISGDPLYINENQTDIKNDGGKAQLASIIKIYLRIGCN